VSDSSILALELLALSVTVLGIAAAAVYALYRLS
jgi:hypothetical protein